MPVARERRALADLRAATGEFEHVWFLVRAAA
jgi:hypothetical protein